VRWGAFSVYGVKLHPMCATNRLPISYVLTAASTADVLLVEELLDEGQLGSETARRLFGDLAYRSGELGKVLAERNVLLATEPSARRPRTQATSRGLLRDPQARLWYGGYTR